MTRRYQSSLYGKRLPFAPLRLICERRHRGWDNAHLTHITKTAEVLGVSREVVHRWERHGVPMVTADRAAVSLGLHPGMIWPEWWHA
jgi:hypothetical protein